MKKVITIILILYLPNLVIGQSLQLPTNPNFYDALDNYYQTFEADSAEGSLNKKINDLNKIWGTRLFAHSGKMNTPANAIIDYALNYTPNQSTFNANWTSLGPFKDQEVYNSLRGSGTGQIHNFAFSPNYNGTSNKTLYAISNFG
jgi:hypothetical protein